MRWIWALSALLILLAGCARDEPPPAPKKEVAPPPADEAVQSPAQLVLRNGYIYTVDRDKRIAQAMAVREGRIVYVGGDSGVDALIGPDTRVEDLAGRLVLPGFVDAHMHVRGLGNMVNLYGGKSVRDYQDAVAEFIRAHPDHQVIVGKGWDNAVFAGQSPHKALLDQVNDLIPIVLFSSDHHTIWTNSEGLAAAGIDSETPNPEGGVIEKDETGIAIGVLREGSAMALVENIIPQKSEDDYRAEIREVQEQVVRWGITTIHDARIKPEKQAAKLAAYQKMAALDDLHVRVRASFEIDADTTSKQIDELKALSQKYQDDDFQIYSVKLFADGVVEGQTAFLKEPYAHRPDYRGNPLFSQEAINQLAKLANARRMQVQVHAIGDAATRMALDAFIHSRDINGPADQRNSIVHLQLVDNEDLDLFVETKTIAIVQPFWFVKERYYQELELPFLGQARADSEYPMKSFFERGITVASSSDYPVEIPNNPLVGIQIGITRRAPDAPVDDPARVLGAEQRVTLEQMVESFTINGAFANRLENETGSLEVGKWADFIVFDKNLFQIPVEEIHKARVLRTYYKGKPVYDADTQVDVGE
ncbi:amidohydrolase [Microbulbifer donghaiensis]|nr:amidohydrolase [Microbulbifer donghaiensis]